MLGGMFGLGQQPQQGQAAPQQQQPFLGGLFGSDMMPFYAALAFGADRSQQAQLAAQALGQRSQLNSRQRQFEAQQEMARQEMAALERYRQSQLGLRGRALDLEAQRMNRNDFSRQITNIREAVTQGLITPEQGDEAITRLTGGSQVGRAIVMGPDGSLQILEGPGVTTGGGRGAGGIGGRDFVPRIGPDGELQGVAPVPGSDPDYERQQDRQAAERRQAQTSARENNLLRAIDQAQDLAAEFPTWTTGLGGVASRQIPGTPGSDMSSVLQTIKANIAFEQLQQMRESSPTGGALGQVSNMEIGLLQNAAAAVEQSQSRQQFLENLAYLENLIRRIPLERLDGARPGTPSQGQNRQIYRADDYFGR